MGTHRDGAEVGDGHSGMRLAQVPVSSSLSAKALHLGK